MNTIKINYDSQTISYNEELLYTFTEADKYNLNDFTTCYPRFVIDNKVVTFSYAIGGEFFNEDFLTVYEINFEDRLDMSKQVPIKLERSGNPTKFIEYFGRTAWNLERKAKETNKDPVPVFEDIVVDHERIALLKLYDKLLIELAYHFTFLKEYEGFDSEVFIKSLKEFEAIKERLKVI